MARLGGVNLTASSSGNLPDHIDIVLLHCVWPPSLQLLGRRCFAQHSADTSAWVWYIHVNVGRITPAWGSINSPSIFDSHMFVKASQRYSQHQQCSWGQKSVSKTGACSAEQSANNNNATWPAVRLTALTMSSYAGTSVTVAAEFDCSAYRRALTTTVS